MWEFTKGKSGSLLKRCFNGSASLMSIYTALSFLQENKSALSSIELVSNFVPHFNSNTYLTPRKFCLGWSVFFKTLRKRSKFLPDDVISYLPIPRFFTFSLIGSLTVSILQFCNAENWLPISSEPRNAFSAVSNENLFMHTEKLLEPKQLSI